MNHQIFQNIPKKLQNMSQEILEHIAKHDGKWTWYQLDRILSHDENLPYMDKLIEILQQLEANNLIISDDSESTSQPKYWIAENGKSLLETDKTATTVRVSNGKV